MKNIYKLIAILFIATAFTGCVSTNKMSNSAVVTSPGKVIHHQLEADISIDDTQKLKGSSKSTYFLMFRIEGDSEYADGVNYNPPPSAGSGSLLKQIFGFLNPFSIINALVTGDAEGKVKASAAYDALSSSDADFLAHPTYTYTKKNWIIIQQFEANVEGYPGKYSNFRSYDAAQRRLDMNIDHQVNKKIVQKLIIGDGLEK